MVLSNLLIYFIQSMFTITHNKIAGFEPRWAPFTGFSLLFDNPGPSTSTTGDHLKISCPSEPDGPLDFYFRLEQAVDALDRDLLTRTYLFCPLPTSSYHVTAWDGINTDNVSHLHSNLRSDWRAFLQGIPRSLGTPPESMAIITESELAGRSPGTISFRFQKLSLWGNQTLVARLSPVDAASKTNMKDLVTARTELCRAAKRKWGTHTPESYSPHVSLGYFANREHAQLASAHLSNWTERFRSKLEQPAISYDSLDVYAFTDMVSFFKIPKP